MLCLTKHLDISSTKYKGFQALGPINQQNNLSEVSEFVYSTSHPRNYFLLCVGLLPQEWTQ